MDRSSAAKRVASFLDPTEFSRVWLNRRIWDQQREIALSIVSNPLTAVKGCHASGKTFQAAGLPLWWITRYPRGKVFITAPTQRQVKTFIQEIALARRDSPCARYLPEPTALGLFMSEDRYILGASSSRGVNLQGFHGSDVLIIVDEAPGVLSDIWDAIEGIRAGGRVHVLKLGNPVVPVGEFYDSFHRARGINNCISISAFDSPNLRDEQTGKPLTFEELLAMPDERLSYAPFPYLITRRWVKERYTVWGPDHPKFRSRVLAEFPTQSPYSVFDLAWIERAKRDATERELEQAKGRTIQVGIDVAGAGDDETALTARVNGIILEQHAWPDPDPRGAVSAVLRRLAHHPIYRLGVVVVDIVGIGYNFATHLADQGFQVFGFQAGARPIDMMLYENSKAEAYFAAREYFKQGLIAGLNDEECEAQLSTMLYRETPAGKTEIRSKDHMRKAGVQSPDRAESLIMAFMRVVPAAREETYSGYQISSI